ncbi:hypothetical protein C8F01DRAFT_1205308 [Mycena amicta]|nr:hypothetical protein C8F01DRAFT_1205308 [Mycena amicta]
MSSSAPRPSASLVIINSRNEVLFVHRNPDARSFGGVHVFPGGNFDASQDTSLADTAIRETFEEAGLLLASSSGKGSTAVDNVTLDAARKAIHANQTPWQDFLKTHKLNPDVNALLARSPNGLLLRLLHGQRFQTQFFVTFLAAASSTGFSSGTREERIPTSDGGLEVLSARFLHPQTALSLFAAREIILMPPQFYIVKTLADILAPPNSGTTPDERAVIERLAQGAFGRLVINPLKFVPPAGTEVGPRGRMHRAVVKMDKAGVTSEIDLLRNFNIFTEVEELIASSKL